VRSAAAQRPRHTTEREPARRPGWLLAGYGFLASFLPGWVLLVPRGYLSTFMKLGVVVMLGLGVVLLAPTIEMPRLTVFAQGGGPIIPGPLFPFLFITIACGAISGFHSLVASGTTPKMIERETHAPVGYGAMLLESFVGVMALIAASVLVPGDYLAINTLLSSDALTAPKNCLKWEVSRAIVMASSLAGLGDKGRNRSSGPHRLAPALELVPQTPALRARRHVARHDPSGS
jgi:carbon starvation protein CstA